MKPNVIVDLDGTIADMRHRLPFIKGPGKKDWKMFHLACLSDTPKEDIITVVNALYNAGQVIHIISGRNTVAFLDTVQWLTNHGVLHHTLNMRKHSDRRDDTVVKEAIANRLELTPENTLCIFEDRQRVVDHWRELGFTVCQVDAWKEE
jgi:hypothetical protein